MSWIDRYTKDLVIRTGDEEEFTLYTLPSFSKEIEYHGTEFEFSEVAGQLIKKRKLKSRSFPLEFFFIGDDNLEEARSFEFSAEHPDPWLIRHPYYDNLLVQVLSIKFDSSELNVTKVTCVARETITDSGVQITSSPVDIVRMKKIEVNDNISLNVFDDASIQEINSVTELTDKNYKTGVKIIQDPFDAEEYFNALNTANSYINTITETPIQAMTALTAIITAPAQFEAKVQDRIRVFMTQFENLRATIIGLTTVTSKRLFTIQGINQIGGMCLASVNPLAGDYNNAVVALDIASHIKATYATFISDVDSLQGTNGGNPLSFFSTFNDMKALNDLVNTTTSNLFDIALAGRKQFEYVLTEDSNVIILTNRFYGLDAQDSNINDFISNNALTYREIALGLPKGKTVTYYA